MVTPTAFKGVPALACADTVASRLVSIAEEPLKRTARRIVAAGVHAAHPDVVCVVRELMEQTLDAWRAGVLTLTPLASLSSLSPFLVEVDEQVHRLALWRLGALAQSMREDDRIHGL